MPPPGEDLYGVPMLPSTPEYRAAGGLDMGTLLQQFQQQRQQDESVAQQESQFAEIMNARNAYDAQAQQQASYQKAYQDFVDWPTFQKDTTGTEPGRQYDSYLTAFQWQLEKMGYSPEEAQQAVELFQKQVPRPPEDRGFLGNLFQAGTSGVESGIRAVRAATAGSTDPALLAQLAADQAGAELSAPQARFQEQLGEFKDLPEDTIAKYTEIAKRYYDAGVKEPQGFMNFIVQQVAQSVGPVMGMSAAGGAAGTLAGGPVGTVIGIAGGAGAGSLALDAGSTMLDVLLDTAKARGIDPRDQQALLALLQDPEVRNKVITDGFKHGVPVAIMDGAISAISFGIGNSAIRSLRQGAKVAATAKSVGGTAIDPFLSAEGEKLGQVAQGVDQPQDVFAEALLGPATGLPHMAAGAVVGAARGLRATPSVTPPAPPVTPGARTAEGDISATDVVPPGGGPPGGGPPGETADQMLRRLLDEAERNISVGEAALPTYDVTELPKPAETINIGEPIPTYPVTEGPPPTYGVQELPAENINVTTGNLVQGLLPAPGQVSQSAPTLAVTPGGVATPQATLEAQRAAQAAAAEQERQAAITRSQISIATAPVETIVQHMQDIGIKIGTDPELIDAINTIAMTKTQQDRLAAIGDVMDGLVNSKNPQAEPMARELVKLAQQIQPKVAPLTVERLAAEAAQAKLPLEQVLQIIAEEVANASPPVTALPPSSIATNRGVATQQQKPERLPIQTRRGLRVGETVPAPNLAAIAAQLAGRGLGTSRANVAENPRGPGRGLRAGLAQEGAVAQRPAGGPAVVGPVGGSATSQSVSNERSRGLSRLVKGWRSFLKEEEQGTTPADVGNDVGNLRSAIRATPGVDMTRMAKLLGPQLYGNMNDIGPITIKELFQNAFDALKGAIALGQRKDGEIAIDFDKDTRTIKVTDNGTGMTPETINNAFLTLAGTMKETERASGGLGIAKMLFLFGNESLTLRTVRNGVESTLHTSGAQLMQTFSDPSKAPDIQTRKTTGPSGTSVTVKIPDTFYNEETGKDEAIEFPDRWSTQRQLSDSPLFENVTVKLNGNELPIGKNFPTDEYTVLTVAKFPWGKVRVLVAPVEYPGYENVAMLSNGLLQFKTKIRDNPTDPFSRAAPYKFFFNIEPSVKADAPNYPIALNRKGLSPAAKTDFDALLRYLTVMYATTKTEAESQSFGVLTQFSQDGKAQKQIDLAVPAAKPGTTLKIDKNDKVEVRDGRMYVNNRAMPEMTKEQLEQLKHDPTQFRVDQALLDPDMLIVHDNVLLNDKPYLEQARAALGNEAVNGYLLGFARVLQRLRDAAAKLGGEKYQDIRAVPVGASIDTEYYGVNTMIPFKAMMFNPTVFRGTTIDDAPATAVGTMIHEIAHHTERNHDPTGFIPELQRMMVLMARSGNMINAIMDLETVMRKYPQVYEYFAKEAKDGNLTNRGIRLAGGEERIGSQSPVDRTAVASEAGRNGGDSANLRQAIRAGNQGSTASQGRAGTPAANAGVTQQTPQAQAQQAYAAKLPTTAVAGHLNGMRTHIAYKDDPTSSNSLYTLYPVTPQAPKGVKGQGIKNLTRARVEAQITQAGSEVLAPLEDTIPQPGTPRNSSTEMFGYAPNGDLQVAAYEQKDGTWTYYESQQDIRTDPNATRYKGLSKVQAQNYLAAKNVQPTAPPPGAVQANGTSPTPIQYKAPSPWEVTWANFKQSFNNIDDAQKALGEDNATRVGLASDLVNSNIQRKKRQVVAQFVEPVSKAGAQISKDFNKTQDQIMQVMVHLHLMERSTHKIRQFQSGNLQGQALQDKIQQQEDHYKKGEDFITEENRQNPNFVAAVKRDLAPKMQAMGNNTLDMAVEYGFLSRNAAEAMKAAYDFYVPLITIQERTPVGKAATGRSEAGDLSFARMQQQAYGTIIRGETNRPIELLGRLVEAGRLVDKDGTPVATEGSTLGIKYDEATNSLNEALDSHVFDKNAIPYWREGIRHQIITKDDAIIQAANKYQGPVRETALTKMLGIAGFVTHTMALGKTALSPAFSFFNLPRDIFMANVNIDPRISRVEFAKQLVDPRTVLSSFYNSFRDAFGKDMTGLFGEARDAGAFIDHRALQGLDNIANSVEAAFNPTTKQKLQKRGQQTYKILVAFAQAIESTTRYAMYKAALASNTMSKEEAAAAAKNASINFERRGLAHKYVSPLYMFANAKLQGLHAMTKLWERSSKPEIAMFLGAMSVLGVMAAALGMKYSDKDKDGKSKYSKIPDYRKDSMIVFGEDSSIPGIPLPQEISPFYVIPNALMEYKLGGKTLGETSSRIFTNIINSTIPVNVPQSEIFGHKARPVEFAMRAFTPSPLQVGADLMTNRNTFGSEVVSGLEDKRKRGEPGYAMGSAQEQTLAVNRAKTLQAYGIPEDAANAITNPAKTLYKATGGFLDAAPQQLRLINNYFDPIAETTGFWRDLLGLRESTYEGDIVNPIERKFTGKATVFYDQDQFDEILAKAKRAAFLAKEPGGFDKLSPEEQALAKSAAMLSRVESDTKALFKSGTLLSKEQLKLRQDRKHELILDGIRRYNELHDRMVK